MPLQCCDCGATIVRTGSRGPSPKRCAECRLAAKTAALKHGGSQAKHEHVCTSCSTAFCSGRKSQKFCSTACYRISRRKRLFVVCANSICRKVFETTPGKILDGRKYCCLKCSPARPRRPLLVCHNPSCGKQFRMKHFTKNPWQNKGKYCCPECFRDHYWGSHRPRKKTKAKDLRRSADRAIGTSLRKRCKVFGVTFDPACTRQLVLDRDRWLCQKCGCVCNKEYRLDPATKRPHPRNAEHDHIIPLSVAGSLGNVFENSQCLCRTCNGKKRDRSEGQLRLCLEEGAWGNGVRVRSQQHLGFFVGTQASGRSTTASRSRQPMA